MTNQKEQELEREIDKKHNLTMIVRGNALSQTMRELNILRAELKGIKETKAQLTKDIIALFKKDSIYTGAVIEFEIKQMMTQSKQEVNQK